MQGLGDSIYQRAFVKRLPAGSYIQTAWPEIYEDLQIKPVRSKTKLRTQQKNEQYTGAQYFELPARFERRRISYGPGELERGSIIDAMRNNFGVEHGGFDLPTLQPATRFSDMPVAVIRPATVRSEWRSDSRNPDPEYLAEAARILRRNFYVISVADLEEGKEWLIGDPPVADLQLHRGELPLRALMSLVQNAAVVVTPVGWALPAAICYQTPVYVVAGGRGAHNAPEIVTDPDMDLSRVGWAMPDNYCRCHQWDHQCDKRITGFGEKFEAWLYERVLSKGRQ
jgi:hypothetical protein